MFDCTVARVSVRVEEVTIRILAAFTGIALAANAVHGNRQRFVRFLADRAIGHRTRLKSFDNHFDRLDLFDGNRPARGLELHEPAQSTQLARLIINARAVFPEGIIVAGATSVLKLMNGLGVKLVYFAVTSILVLASLV